MNFKVWGTLTVFFYSTVNNQIVSIPSEIGLLTNLQSLAFRESVHWLSKFDWSPLSYSYFIVPLPKCLLLDNNNINFLPSELGQLSNLKQLFFCKFIHYTYSLVIGSTSFSKCTWTFLKIFVAPCLPFKRSRKQYYLWKCARWDCHCLQYCHLSHLRILNLANGQMSFNGCGYDFFGQLKKSESTSSAAIEQ